MTLLWGPRCCRTVRPARGQGRPDAGRRSLTGGWRPGAGRGQAERLRGTCQPRSWARPRSPSAARTWGCRLWGHRRAGAAVTDGFTWRLRPPRAGLKAWGPRVAHDGLFLGLETPGQLQDEDKPGPLPGRAPGRAGGRRALAGIRDTDQSRRGGRGTPRSARTEGEAPRPRQRRVSSP